MLILFEIFRPQGAVAILQQLFHPHFHRPQMMAAEGNIFHPRFKALQGLFQRQIPSLQLGDFFLKSTAEPLRTSFFFFGHFESF